MAPNATACRFWRDGSCKAGDKCQFSHDSSAAKVDEKRAIPSEPAPSNRQARKQKFKKRSMVNGTGMTVHVFEPSNLENSSIPVVRLENYTLLASYNWTNAKEATIVVPGCPARWTAPDLPHQLPKDKGKFFVDQNAYRCPKSTFDPLFKALLTLQPNFNMTPISLVADRNSLRKLFHFAAEHSGMSFRIEVELIHYTLFLTRWELNSVTKITDAMNHGYGYEFEKAFTAVEQGLQGSSGHYRIVQYDLGGIKCLVRCETDAFLLDGSSSVEITINESDAERPTKRHKITDIGEPTFSESQVLESTKGPAGGIKVVQGGQLVPRSSIIEIKSCNKDINHKMREVVPQLWFSQTAYLFIGRHKKGLMANVEQVATGPLLQKWEMEQQDQLKKLVALIEKIKNAASSTKAGKVVLLYDSKEKPQKMRVLVSNRDGSVVSKEVKEMCWGKLPKR